MLEIILAIALVTLMFFASLNYGKAAEKTFKDASKKLPPGAKLELKSSISGHSRKKVITYYRYYVEASITSADGSILKRTFDYANHEPDKIEAINAATNWINQFSNPDKDSAWNSLIATEPSFKNAINAVSQHGEEAVAQLKASYFKCGGQMKIEEIAKFISDHHNSGHNKKSQI